MPDPFDKIASKHGLSPGDSVAAKFLAERWSKDMELYFEEITKQQVKLDSTPSTCVASMEMALHAARQFYERK